MSWRPCLPHAMAVGASDVHEQKKPWVPLMLEASYRPSGWLGIMCVHAAMQTGRRGLTVPAHSLAAAVAAGARRLGSRLYFEFTGAALGDSAAWEGLADGVAVEVRRHGAPPPPNPQSAATAPAAPTTAVAEHDVGEAAPSPATAQEPAALAAPRPERGLAAPAGVSVQSVHVDNTANHTNNSTNKLNTINQNTNTNNTGNTSILLL